VLAAVFKAFGDHGGEAEPAVLSHGDRQLLFGETAGATAGGIFSGPQPAAVITVSYTHLDVYKRQEDSLAADERG